MHSNVEHYQQLAHVYRLFYRDFDASMRQEAGWLVTLLRDLGARTVLDACCGTGRQAIPLAGAGFLVVGADPCGAMLAEARQAAAEHQRSPVWLQSDFEGLPVHLTVRFDAVIAFGNGLCHCPDREHIVRALSALHACCSSSGACLIGIRDFDRIRRSRVRRHRFGQRDGAGAEGSLWQTLAIDDRQLVCTTMLRQRDSDTGRLRSIVTAQTREYMLGRVEMAELAAEAGFRSVQPVAHPWELAYLLLP